MTQTAIIILTIAVYLIFMAVMGITTKRSVKTLSDFTVGGGNASAWLSALSYGVVFLFCLSHKNSPIDQVFRSDYIRKKALLQGFLQKNHSVFIDKRA